MASLAVIPARGGSRRIPRKNIKEFLGHPIIWYPIQAALRVFDKVVVSTEDAEIKQIASQWKAEVIDRPLYLADDYTTTGEVATETAMLFPEYEVVGMLYPTAVFVTPELIRRAIDDLGDADSIFTVIEYGHPIQRALTIENGLMQFINQGLKTVRTQDLAPRYFDAGQLYIMKREALIKNRTMYSEKMRPLVIKDYEAQDLDTLDDWRVAEIKYEFLQGKGKERR